MDGRTFRDLVRPFTLLAPAVGSLSGAVAAAAATDVALPVGTVALGVAAALSATGASNAWNQAFDADIDRVNKPERPIPAGRVTVGAALRLGHVLAALALALGLLATPAFGACIAVGVLCTWIYSAPPLRTKASLVGALLTIAVPRGLLVPVAGWSLVVAPWTRTDPWALGVVIFLFVLGAAATKDFADVAGDRAHGCRTLPVVLGARRAAVLIAPFLALPFLLLVAAAGAGWLGAPLPAWAVLAGLLTALGAVAAWTLVREPEGLASRGTNHPAWKAMYLLMLGFHVGAALVYVLAG